MKNIPITQIKMISTILFENGIKKWNSELSVSKWLPLLIVTLNLIKRFVTKLNPDGDTFTEANRRVILHSDDGICKINV